MLEIVERQPQQAVEDVQIEPGIEPRPDDRNDQSTCITEQRFKGENNRHDRGQKNQRRNAVKLQNLVHGRHDQQRRENSKDADGQRCEADVAQRCALVQHNAGEPAKAKL